MRPWGIIGAHVLTSPSADAVLVDEVTHRSIVDS